MFYLNSDRAKLWPNNCDVIITYRQEKLNDIHFWFLLVWIQICLHKHAISYSASILRKMLIRVLSSELQEKAKKELNEVPKRIQEDLQHIRHWISKQPHLNVKQGKINIAGKV